MMFAICTSLLIPPLLVFIYANSRVIMLLENIMRLEARIRMLEAKE